MGLTVAFQVPAWIKAGLNSGLYELIGGVIRDAETKKIVKWLRPLEFAEAAREAGDPVPALGQALNVVATAALHKQLRELRVLAEQTSNAIRRVERRVSGIRSEQWHCLVDPLRAGCEFAQLAEQSVERKSLLRQARAELVRGRTALVARLRSLDTGELLALGADLPAHLDMLHRATVVDVAVQRHLGEVTDRAYARIPEVSDVFDQVAERIEAGAPGRRLPRASELEGARCWKRSVEVARASSHGLRQFEAFETFVATAVEHDLKDADGRDVGTSLEAPAPEGADLRPVRLEAPVGLTLEGNPGARRAIVQLVVDGAISAPAVGEALGVDENEVLPLFLRFTVESESLADADAAVLMAALEERRDEISRCLVEAGVGPGEPPIAVDLRFTEFSPQPSVFTEQRLFGCLSPILESVEVEVTGRALATINIDVGAPDL